MLFIYFIHMIVVCPVCCRFPERSHLREQKAKTPFILNKNKHCMLYTVFCLPERNKIKTREAISFGNAAIYVSKSVLIQSNFILNKSLRPYFLRLLKQKIVPNILLSLCQPSDIATLSLWECTSRSTHSMEWQFLFIIFFSLSIHSLSLSPRFDVNVRF